MKTCFILLGAILLTANLSAQKLISKNGHIWFFSGTPMENIEAHNKQVVGVLDKGTGSIQFSLLIKSFEFERKLMQEHFNENYLESDKYPKATFSGNLLKFGSMDMSKPGTYPIEAEGDLTIHGVTQKVTIPGIIIISEKEITAKANFKVKSEDYGIKIPDVVKDKIAKEIEVNVEVPYLLN
jgi:polyisoprenoid-binding protein YceI